MIKINREILVKKLIIASKATNPKEDIEQSDSFVFTEDFLYAFNGMCLTKQATPLKGFVGSVKAGKFLQFLQKFPDDVIKVSWNEKQIKIVGKNKRGGITIQSKINTELVDGVDLPTDYVDVPKDFGACLLKASRICGKDYTRPNTTHVHVTNQKIEATDSTKAFRAFVESDCSEFIMCAEFAKIIGSLLVEKIATNDTWASFMVNDIEIAVVIAQDEYFNGDIMDNIFNCNGTSIALPTDFQDAISRAGILQDEQDKNLIITLSKESVIISIENSTGWYQEKLPVSYNGENCKFSLPLVILLDLLSKSKNMLFEASKIKIELGNMEYIAAIQVVEE